jgi:hypothetical protein
MKKFLFLCICALLFAPAIFSQDGGESESADTMDVVVYSFFVDGVDRTSEIAEAFYVFDSDGGYEELYLYDAAQNLIEYIFVADYTIDYADEEYEELIFEEVWAERLQANEEIALEAYGEYDYYNEYVYWEIYETESGKTRVEIEFW